MEILLQYRQMHLECRRVHGARWDEVCRCARLRRVLMAKPSVVDNSLPCRLKKGGRVMFGMMIAMRCQNYLAIKRRSNGDVTASMAGHLSLADLNIVDRVNR